jgi:hypothetical protein
MSKTAAAMTSNIRLTDLNEIIPIYPTLPTYDLLTASRRGALKENREMGSTLDRTAPVFPLSALMATTSAQHRLHHFAFL